MSYYPQKVCVDCGVALPRRALREEGKQIVAKRQNRCAFCLSKRRKDARQVKRDAMRP